MKSNWDADDPKPGETHIIDTEPPMDAILTCMEGDQTKAKWPDSVTGTCDQCNKVIHYSSTAPVGIRRHCRECVYNEIIETGKVADLAITEVTLKEGFKHLGIEDTPANRKKAVDFCQTQYLAWLKEGIGKK